MRGEILIPILVPLGLFAMIFGLVYLKSRENMALIEKGINPKQIVNVPTPFKNLKYGLLLFGSGVGLLIAYILDELVVHSNDENPALWFSLIAIGGGLGLITSYRIEKKEVLDKEEVYHKDIAA
jgi:hypothetical protein